MNKILRLAEQSIETATGKCPCDSVQTWPHLLAVLADVSVDLMEGTEHVELSGVKTGLFRQIGIHILITDGRQPVDVSVVPGRKHAGTHSCCQSQGYSRAYLSFFPHLDSVFFREKVRKYQMLKVPVNQRCFGRNIRHCISHSDFNPYQRMSVL